MRKIGSLRQLLQLGRLARDEEGTVLIYVSIALTVFMGFAALVIDGSRLFTLDTEMQSASDALALAGAAELDGNTDAIDRATTAMDNLVRNYETFGDKGTPITGYTARFLTALPADDSEPITPDLETTDGADARFVEVNLQPEGEGVDNSRSISVMFATAIGAGNTARAGSVSVAGYNQAVCKFTPLFICNPYEDTNGSLEYFTSKMDDPKERRKIIALKKSGSGASMFPGNFGFLESDLGNGANALKQSLAQVNPESCFRKDGVETQTGSVNSARHAVNTRFDMYEGNFNSKKNDSSYRPARNVTKGYTYSGANACNAALNTSTPPKAMAFPHDSVIGSNRMGNGVWDFTSYWNVNHPGLSPPNGWANTDDARPSRYDVYRWEIDNNHIPNNKAIGGENGNPGCNKQPVSDTPDRRIIFGAVLNCKALGLKGGGAGTVPAVAFIKMFITEPMTKLPGTGQTDEDDTLYTELMGVVKPGTDDEVVHDMVQLYR